MLKIKSVLKNLFFSLFLICFASCELFQNDVVDYMEQFTGTAAIEDHEFNVATYKDAIEQLCISSEQDSEIVFFMRNPKKYVLEPSVTFEALDSAISRSAVQIIQTDADTLTLSLPLEFLIAADEGKDISAQIDICEPATGREFEPYSVSLHCNTVPPAILNPTIINNNNTSFIVAFDMPSPEEVALRHKDICEIVIGGQSFPVKITTVADPDVEGAYKAVYEIQDERFTTEFSTDFTFIREKSFAHNDGTSFYFETEQPYNQGDKEYTLVLKDSAGLSSSVKASTSVAKLQKPVIINQNNTAIVEGRMTGIPYTEETKTGAITIYPPTKDHFGNDVSGARIYYRVYELTGSGRVYTSGTSREPVTLELPQNTYRVEAYATLWNYENSATTKVKFRFMNNVINLRACSDPEGFVGDGSEGAPYASFAEVIADINSREPRDVKYTVNVEGDFTVNTYSKDAETGLVSYGSYGDIVLTAVDTDEFIIQKNPKASEAKLKSITLESTLDSSLKVLVDGIEINNSASSGIKNASGVELTIKNITVSGASGYGIEVTSGTVILNSGTVSSNGYGGAGVTGGTFTLAGGSLTGNSQGIISTGTGIVNVTGGSVSSNSGWGIYQIGGTINLSGGSISGNQQGGVQQTGVVKVSGKPYVYNNYDVSGDRCDIQVPSGKNITVAGALTFGARIGVKLDSGRTPTAIGDQYSFTSGYSNTDSPSNYFISDDGFAIIRGTGSEASVALSGASGTSTYSADDYTFSFTVSPLSAGINEAKTVTITPTVKRREISGAYTTLTYNTTDGLLYDSAGVEASSVAGELLTVTAAFYDGVVKIQNLTLSPGAGNTFTTTVPAQICISNYKIIVKATFCGTVHSTEFNYVVSDVPVGFVSVPGVTIPATTTGVSGSHVFIANRALTIPNLWVCDHEVTQAEYVAVIGSNPSSFSSNPASGETQENRPVENVHWYEALVYCNKRSMAEGLTPCYEIAGSTDPDDWGSVPTSTSTTWDAVTCNFNANGYRLPTDAEWEYCARGGDLTGEQTTHSGTNEGNLSNYAWYSGNSNTNSKTHEVGKLSPNAKGLYDMSGNVWEWCWDWAGSISTSTGAAGPASGSSRVYRGGSWDGIATYCTVSNRGGNYPYRRSNNLGFRVVRSAQ